MKVGLFTDTYFPQISGVATSIKTLKDALEAEGHTVYIFTSTDPKVPKPNANEERIFRFASIPYLGFKERRLAFRGLIKAVDIAREIQLDIVHTQTEFSLGILGKVVARQLKIPSIHTYHTMYEDYTHYFAKGKIIRPGAVGVLMKAYMKHMTGVIAPSTLVKQTLLGYGVTCPISVIPTGVPVAPPASTTVTADLRQQYGLTADQPVILSLGRLAYEKNICATITAFAELHEQYPEAHLMIVGDGPARKSLEEQVTSAGLNGHVTFTGMVAHDRIADYYALSRCFVSSSDSETQGLTFVEALAANRPFVAMTSPFLADFVDGPAIGRLLTADDQLVTALAAYLVSDEQTPAACEQRAAKLVLMGADTFAARVLACYQEAQARYYPEKSPDATYPNAEDISYARKLFRNPFKRD